MQNDINIVDHLNLIHHVLKKYVKQNDQNYADLFQSGIIGLSRAIKYFDPAKGKFGPVAYLHILKEVQKEYNKMLDAAISYKYGSPQNKFLQKTLSLDQTYDEHKSGACSLYSFLSNSETPDSIERKNAILKLASSISNDIDFVEWIFTDPRCFTKEENKHYNSKLKKYYRTRQIATYCLRLRIRKLITNNPILREYFSANLKRLRKRKIYGNIKSKKTNKMEQSYIALIKGELNG